MASIIGIIKADHLDIIACYESFKDSVSESDRQKWLNKFIWLVCRHSVAEELTLYPLLASINTEGQQKADKARQEQHELKQVLSKALKDGTLASQMDNVMSTLRTHMDEEEQDDLVFMESHLSTDKLQKAGKMFNLKKKFVPTRPHPMIPEKPVMIEAMLGLLVAPIDKFGDLFRKRA